MFGIWTLCLVLSRRGGYSGKPWDLLRSPGGSSFLALVTPPSPYRTFHSSRMGRATQADSAAPNPGDK